MLRLVLTTAAGAVLLGGEYLTPPLTLLLLIVLFMMLPEPKGARIKIEGSSVLITGAAMGMGKIYAFKAAKEKAARIILWDMNKDGLEKVAKELKAEGYQGSLSTQVVDVSDSQSISSSAAQCLADGTVHCVVNNAGIVRGKMFWDHHDEKDTELTMKVNTLGPMWITRQFLPKMLESRAECRVVNIGSAAGLVPNPKMSVYCASKAACFAWSDSLRIELKESGYSHVKVTSVCPSYISTGMFDGVKAPLLTPILTPEMVTDTVWEAMKWGKPLVLMPWSINLSMFFRGILSSNTFDLLAGKVFGVYGTMEKFQGRKSVSG